MLVETRKRAQNSDVQKTERTETVRCDTGKSGAADELPTLALRGDGWQSSEMGSGEGYGYWSKTLRFVERVELAIPAKHACIEAGRPRIQD